MRKPKMPLRCAYKAYAVICRDDGTICAGLNGDHAVYATAKRARTAMHRYPSGNEVLTVARCYIVPAEMWKR